MPPANIAGIINLNTFLEPVLEKSNLGIGSLLICLSGRT